MLTVSPNNNLKPEENSISSGPAKAYISTYGCQMNSHDTERMYALLEMSNYTQVHTPEEADVIIINSCSVREKPVHKVMSEIGSYRPLKEKNPMLKIGVAGCVAQQEGKNLLEKTKMIDFVMGTDQIDMLPQLLQEVGPYKAKAVKTKVDHRGPYQISTLVRNAKVSAFVTITKGCDNFCSFCIVPFTRGREKSRLLNEIVNDINQLHAKGVQEVTLLGQNVNSYKSPDQSGDFVDLLRAICSETKIKRLRYTTSHPKDFDNRVIDTHVQYQEKLGLYLHLPVQSGSTKVLKEMNRGYSREEYLEKLNGLKKRIPDMALSTDVIVGFPGETEEDFLETLSLLETVRFENVYAYKYSPRPFTKALKLPKELSVPEKVMDERLNRLMDLQDKIGFEIAPRYDNNVYEILVEGPSRSNPETLTGRTAHNKVVNFLGNEDLIGKTVPMKILKSHPYSMRAEVI